MDPMNEKQSNTQKILIFNEITETEWKSQL